VRRWKDETLFPLGEADKLGQKLAAEINAKMIGRIGGASSEHGVLAQMVHNAGDGNHLEFGTTFGGSAILAGLIKEHYGLRGKVVCVDAMKGYHGNPDPVCGMMASEQIFHENVEQFGLEKRIELIVGESTNADLEHLGVFTSGSITGGHDFHSVAKDWNRMKGMVGRYVLFGNYYRANRGVGEVVRIANEERDWRCVLIYGISALFERIEYGFHTE